MEHCTRYRRKTHQPLNDSLDHRQKNSCSNTYSEGPGLQRHQSSKGIKPSDVRRASLVGGLTKDNIIKGTVLRQRLSQIETSLVSGSFTDRDRSSHKTSTHSTNDKRKRMRDTYQCEKEIVINGSHNSQVPTTTTLPTSFSYTHHNQQQQPFYHTLHPEEESPRTLRRKKQKTAVDPRQSFHNGGRGASIDGYRSYTRDYSSSSSTQSDHSSMFFETSLVSTSSSSSGNYEQVFSPKRQRMSSLSQDEGQSSLYMPMAASSTSSLQRYVPMNSLSSLPKRSYTLGSLSSQTSSDTFGSLTDEEVRVQQRQARRDNSVRKKLGSKTQNKAKNDAQRGKLKIAIYHNQSNMLVHIVSAKNLIPRTKNKSSSEVFVYVKVAVVSPGGHILYSQTTRTARHTKMAKLHEVFTFNPRWQETTGSRLLISVFKKTSQNELAGCMSFGLNTLFENKKTINGWYYILDEITGRSKHLAVKSDDETQCMARPNTILPWITLQRVNLKRNEEGRYGFTILDTMPVQVGGVDKGSAASIAGLRKGDAFLELGGANVAGIKSRSLADILKKTDSDIQALIQRTGDRSQRPLPAPPLHTHTAPARMKHKDGKAIAKAKAKSATVKRPRHQSPINFRDRPRSLPLLEQRLKRELAAKLAARKAKQHLQTSRRRRQQDDMLAPKPNMDTLPPLVSNTATLCSKAPLPKAEQQPKAEIEDIYENSQPEGYYLIPMSQDDSESEDSEPEAEYATIHHNNRISATPGGISSFGSPPPPPPPPPPPSELVQPQPPPSELEDVDEEGNIHYQTPNAARLLDDDKENMTDDEMITSTCAVLARQDGVDEDEDEINEEKTVVAETEEGEPKEGIYENDADLRLSVCKFAADEFGHVYENLDEQIQGVIQQEGDVCAPAPSPDMDRYVEGATDNEAKDRSSTSMQSVRSFESENNTVSSTVTTDESMSGEEMELPLDTMTENIIWAKGLKPVRLGAPTRTLIHVGRLFVKTKKKKLREMLVILFSDILLFCKPLTDGRLKVLHRPLGINDISILDFKRKIAREFCIKLVAGAEHHPVACMCNTIVFRAPTAKLKIVWKKLLQKRLLTVKCGDDSRKAVRMHKHKSGTLREFINKTYDNCMFVVKSQIPKAIR